MAKEGIITRLACRNRDEKWKPLVIGKSKDPRFSKMINTDNLPLFWQPNKKSVMIEFIWIQYFTRNYVTQAVLFITINFNRNELIYFLTYYRCL